MKKQFVLAAVAACLSLSGFAQTQGTSALSLGVNLNTNTLKFQNTESKITNNSFSLGYGYFFRDNTKIGLDLSYGLNKNDNWSNPDQEQKTYGGSLNYQQYFPIIKKLFAYAAGKAAYSHSAYEQSSVNNVGLTNVTTGSSNQYSVGAYGGVTWFINKRFALETSLLSADIVYGQSKQSDPQFNSSSEQKVTSFNLNTSGVINNLGFKIYILF